MSEMFVLFQKASLQIHFALRSAWLCAGSIGCLQNLSVNKTSADRKYG